MGESMRIRPREHQRVAEILREELEEASRRIRERLSEIERQPASGKDGTLDGVRAFYRDLTDNDWSEADEEALAGLEDFSEYELKRLMCDAFRRSRVHPVPSLASLISIAKKGPGASGVEAGAFLSNPDAVPAVERERIANVLHRELRDAAADIASRLKLTDSKAEMLRQHLENIEAAIIGEFSPLV
jgi:hypothetical protein